MKITNFRPHETEPNFAYVDVDYPWWKFKAKQTKIVFKQDNLWRWLDTGKPSPDFHVERLIYAYHAKKQLGINPNYQG